MVCSLTARFSVFFVVALILLQPNGEAIAVGVEGSYCGEPLFAARDLGMRFPPNDAKTIGRQESPDLRTLLAPISKSNIAFFRAQLGELSEAEETVLDLVEEFPPFMIHRTKWTTFQKLMQSKALLSPRELARQGIADIDPFTPRTEDYLFGAWDCVFAAVGAISGKGRYGKIRLIIEPNRLETPTWGAFHSGYSFLEDVRQTEGMNVEFQPVPLDIRHFSENIVAAADWQEALGLQMIFFMRQSEHATEETVAELQKNASRENFWQMVKNYRLGYLEARSEALIPFSAISKIIFPNSLKAELKQWLTANSISPSELPPIEFRDE